MRLFFDFFSCLDGEEVTGVLADTIGSLLRCGRWPRSEESRLPTRSFGDFGGERGVVDLRDLSLGLPREDILLEFRFLAFALR